MRMCKICRTTWGTDFNALKCSRTDVYFMYSFYKINKLNLINGVRKEGVELCSYKKYYRQSHNIRPRFKIVFLPK